MYRWSLFNEIFKSFGFVHCQRILKAIPTLMILRDPTLLIIKSPRDTTNTMDESQETEIQSGPRGGEIQSRTIDKFFHIFER
ncbi:hypothetical protein J6590_008223 [Homalodisca vitripennis]|nr:hypothetical protein J6590_008223 [Homalodisca vitripennis]